MYSVRLQAPLNIAVKMSALKTYETKRDGLVQLSLLSMTFQKKAIPAIISETTGYQLRFKNYRRTNHATDYARNIVS